MPSIIDKSATSKKRKSSKESGVPSSKRRAVAENASAETMARIQQLEDQISESRKHYNNIATLISMLSEDGSGANPDLAVAVSLCRVFSRLIAGGNLTEPERAAENEKIVVQWLRERCREYQRLLESIVRGSDASSQITALTLAMRLLNERATHIPGDDTQAWTSGLFRNVFEAVIEARDGQALRSEFLEKFLKPYDDVAYYTFMQVGCVFAEADFTPSSGTNASHSEYASTARSTEILETLVTILSTCDTVPTPEHKYTNFYSKASKQNKKLLSVNSHKKRAQDAWLSILRNNLSQPLRKTLLRIMVHHIEPWFNRPELLMDFLTDSYNVGGATSLLALSGLFYLIQEKNLDYPQFYPKLYSLLDADLLHSKHRSRFFRLLNTFLASTHLPATLVASFIKRLSRLALNAPPPAIVAIVPFIYNLFKDHPTCTFMLHRVIRDKELQAELEAEGMDDPFDPEESDPDQTGAIESSLWEIESLQSHYHPNVASIARIISEQFTKHSYNLEDFLDYTYQGMLQAELGTGEKPLKKVPVVEYQIPKRIFTDRLLEEDGGVDTAPGNLLRNLWDFS
ncbi:ribosome biosynthesis protein NOC4 [Aspergillus mulundensis]|uniref:Putative CCAAT-box-binding transcription factor n=1 Tax=Aspergillus mulundensis TaxID=1810919 RepID=A0A3D8S5S3_9EURO|nr:putative CCAAT-box-binding transcription factor [Aspergillus mulundensis]RDW81665.1 putative CCAAT-box-binding transcription factor [Aspergillus mulundensis]